MTTDIDTSAAERFSLLDMDPEPREIARPTVSTAALVVKMDLAKPSPATAKAGSPAEIRVLVAMWALAIYALGQWLRGAAGYVPRPSREAAEALFLTRMSTPEGRAPIVSAMLVDEAARRVAPTQAAPVTAPVAMAQAYNPTATVRFVEYTRDSRNRPCLSRLAVVTPFDRGFVRDVKIGTDAAWDSRGPSIPAGAAGVWHFDVQHLPAVRTVLSRYFGTDGGTLPTLPVARQAPISVASEPTASPAAVTQRVPFVPAADLAAERLATIAAAEREATAGESAAQAAAVARERAVEAERENARRLAVAREAARARTAAPVANAAANAQAAGLTDIASALRAPAAPTTNETMASLRNGDIVAGARAEGQGALMGWDGLGEMTRAQMAEHLAAANAPADWIEDSKSAKAHAGSAVNALNHRIVDGRSYIAKVARGIDRTDRRTVEARWVVGPANTGGEVGDTMGRIALTVTLYRSGRLVCEGDSRLAADVTDEFERLRAAEVYAAGDVTAWLGRLLRVELGAVRMAQAWYVRAGNVELAERLLTVISESWGTNWFLPALPIATTAQLRAGLASGLIREATAILRTLETERVAARAATPKRTDIGPGRAATLLASLRTVNDRATQYALILGDEHVAHVRQQIREAIAVVEPLCNEAAQRGAVLEMD